MNTSNVDKNNELIEKIKDKIFHTLHNPQSTRPNITTFHYGFFFEKRVDGTYFGINDVDSMNDCKNLATLLNNTLGNNGLINFRTSYNFSESWSRCYIVVGVDKD